MTHVRVSVLSVVGGFATAVALIALPGCTTLLGDFETAPDGGEPDASFLDGGDAAPDGSDASRGPEGGRLDARAEDAGSDAGPDADKDASLPDACVAESDAALCARHGNTCGGIVATDACGQSRAIASCGTCALPATCGAETPNV